METVCFSHANLAKKDLIDICGRKIIKKHFTSHRYVYSLSQNNYPLLRMGNIGQEISSLHENRHQTIHLAESSVKCKFSGSICSRQGLLLTHNFLSQLHL